MTLAALLEDQFNQLQALLATLDDERQCLDAGLVDGARLSAIAEHKQTQLARLDALEAERRQHQLAAGHGDGQQGAQRLADDSRLGPRWQSIRQLAEQLRQTNRLNGHIISQRLEHNQLAIDFLERVAGGSTYGPNGQSRHQGFGGISSRA